MVVISFLFLLGMGVWVAYWVGRGNKLNAEQRAAARDAVAAGKGRDVHPDALYNTATGEIIEPGTREYSRAVSEGVVFH